MFSIFIFIDIEARVWTHRKILWRLAGFRSGVSSFVSRLRSFSRSLSAGS